MSASRRGTVTVGDGSCMRSYDQAPLKFETAPGLVRQVLLINTSTFQRKANGHPSLQVFRIEHPTSCFVAVRSQIAIQDTMLEVCSF